MNTGEYIENNLKFKKWCKWNASTKIDFMGENLDRN